MDVHRAHPEAFLSHVGHVEGHDGWGRGVTSKNGENHVLRSEFLSDTSWGVFVSLAGKFDP